MPLTAHQEAQEIARLMPATYYHGAFYPVRYMDTDIKIARIAGKGRNARKSHIHIIKPCTRVMKLPDGTETDRWQGTAHYVIELHNESAVWKAVD